jgi:hypothetical protein
MKFLHQLVLHAEGALRAGPNRQLAIVPFGHCGTRLKRRMSDVFDRVLRCKLYFGG